MSKKFRDFLFEQIEDKSPVSKLFITSASRISKDLLYEQIENYKLQMKNKALEPEFFIISSEDTKD